MSAEKRSLAGLLFLGVAVAGGLLLYGTVGRHYAIKNRAEQALRDRMRDPGSVQFRNIRAVVQRDGTRVVVCGEYNAKNGFGAYTGFRGFYVFEDGDARLEGTYSQFQTGWGEFCLR